MNQTKYTTDYTMTMQHGELFVLPFARAAFAVCKIDIEDHCNGVAWVFENSLDAENDTEVGFEFDAENFYAFLCNKGMVAVSKGEPMTLPEWFEVTDRNAANYLLADYLMEYNFAFADDLEKEIETLQVQKNELCRAKIKSAMVYAVKELPNINARMGELSSLKEQSRLLWQLAQL